MSNLATLKGMTRMTLLAGLMCGVAGFAHSQAGAGAGRAPRAADAGVTSGGAAVGGAAVGAAAAGRAGGEGGGMSSSVPGLGGAASEPGGAAPPGKKGPPSISGSNASGRSPGNENPSTLPGAAGGY